MSVENRDLYSMDHLGPHWFAVATAPRHEKRVAERFAGHDLEVFLPVTKLARQWKHRRPVELELPLFAGYVFARFGISERGRVLGTPGVNFIVGNGKQSLPIPNSEINTLRVGLQAYKAEPHPFLAVGDRVLVNSGPLAGFDGNLVRKKSSLRVVIAVKTIMRAFSVEMDLKHLTPLSPASTAKGNDALDSGNLPWGSSCGRESTTQTCV